MRVAHSFDFTKPPPAPRWIVPGFLAAGRVTILSGDTSAAKSMVAQSLTVAAITGSNWLGWRVGTDRVLYLDAENPLDEIDLRLYEFGMRNEHRERLLMFNRDMEPTVNLMDPDDGRWLAERTREHRAGLVIVDTVIGCSDGDVNSHADAKRLYRSARMAAREGAAVLLEHHERKHSDGQRGNASQAMLGARSWAGQADVHWTIAPVGGRVTRTALANGRTLRSYRLRTTDEKQRRGGSGEGMMLALESEHDDDGGPARWMALRRVSDVAPPREDEALALLIRETLQTAGTLKRGELIRRLGVDEGGTLDRALRHAREHLGVEPDPERPQGYWRVRPEAGP